ncbi:NHLP leader peptide family RiPP precursor [Herbivorax sp. ANBcel31]|uniref:NHLP leader peptide family RiPP precursor n=1 Tax=Herbivorax sp. ANBcel31 TaxID=3069754 RepID=UPI0027B6AE0F|nr:NHLP leader peptide family RiPP precursor [Herbivorax sp. ANBcel31]MDQ2084847.1 NHLP leader peptide family RiPP precursor [Herbivorax sp. ANBcel31]
MKAEELREKIIKKATCDEEFKQNLLKEPNKTIEKEFGISTGDNEIKVLEEKQNLFYIVLPYSGEEVGSRDYEW